MKNNKKQIVITAKDLDQLEACEESYRILREIFNNEMILNCENLKFFFNESYWNHPSIALIPNILDEEYGEYLDKYLKKDAEDIQTILEFLEMKILNYRKFSFKKLFKLISRGK